MEKKIYLQFVASFLICLIVNLTLYVPVAYAAITKVSAKGSSGVEGFASSNDFVTFTVQADIGSAITNEMIYLGSSFKFDKCTPLPSSGFECTLKFPPEKENLNPDAHPYTITLYTDKDKSEIDSAKSGAFIVDNKAPEIKLSASKARFSSQDSIDISYDAMDYACDTASCSNKCSGLKNIEFYTLDNAFKKTEEIKSTGCNAQSSISLDAKSLKDGRNSIFAKATDSIGQVSPAVSVTFDVDNTAPVISEGSLSIISKGLSISAFGPSGIPVEVVVNISGADLKEATADLSALNPSQSLKNAKSQCVLQDGINVCKWMVELKPGSEGQKPITIEAVDTAGNKASKTVSRQLSLDNKGPVAKSLLTSRQQDSKALARPGGNQIIAVFEEASGLSAVDVILHAGDSALQAASCSKDLSWVCTWENVNFGAGITSMSISSDTKDIFGNSAPETKTTEVHVDSKAPVLKGIEITPVGGAAPAFAGVFKVGDKIAIVANITEENDVSAAADFSKFISDSKPIQGDCKKVLGDENVCVWLSDSINIAGTGQITLNFNDSAGNMLTVTRQLTVLGLSTGATPDLWNSEVSCSPKSIDRQLGPLISQRVYCQVKLSPKSATQKVSTVFIGQAACSDSQLVQSVETLNTQPGSTSPIIKVTLKKDNLATNNATLSCSFDIFSKAGATINKNPEIENARISLQFANLPLGELSDEVQRKIDDAKKDAQGIWKVIGALNKLIFVFKRLCQLISLFYNIVGALYSAAIFLGWTDVAAQKTLFGLFTITPTAIAGCATATSTRVSVQLTYEKGIHKFCAAVNCYNGKFLLDSLPGMGYIREKYETVQDALNGNVPQPQKGSEDKKKDDKKKPSSSQQSSGQTIDASAPGREGTTQGYGRPIGEFMDPTKNIGVALMYVPPCLPGIIYGLDRYRQIKCLYAHCLQDAVGRDGLPVTACEEQKDYATCKYVTGEVFAFLPWTAFADNFLSIIKDTLSNPFAAGGIIVSLSCMHVCPVPEAKTRTTALMVCEGFRLASQIGQVSQEVASLAKSGVFKSHEDYCENLDIGEDTSKAPLPK
ncbi:hypothetical protein HYS31_04825 [Candidatus Woesearchaeota archaeon]|nr:hypothetical protein [Candidatus Woesearchaeota archaeon]